MEVKFVTKTDLQYLTYFLLFVFFVEKHVCFALILNCAKCELFCAFRHQTPKLGMAKVTQVDFPPREIVSYTKETQTPVMTQQKEGDSLIILYRLALNELCD